MSLFLYILLASLAESIVSFSGGFLAIWGEEKMRKIAHFVVSFAIGALLGVAFLELIPEAAETLSLSAVMSWVLGGIVLFFVLEKFLFWYHCHGGVCPVHTYTYLVLWGDFLHNLIDGIIIALTFMADARLGILTTVAVIFHEIPQEIGDFAVLMHGGMQRRRALFYNFWISLSTLAGALITYAFGDIFASVLPYALALVAGNFIYIASTDLMPELHESTKFPHGFLQFLLIITGIALVILPELLFGAR